MRLKTEIIIAAMLKHAQSLGLFATIVHRGNENAGQIYIILNKNNSEFLLIGPPIGSSFDDEGQKLWCFPLTKAPMAEPIINDYLAKIRKFDTDIYVVEIEDKRLEYRPQGVFIVDPMQVSTTSEADDSAKALKQAEDLFKK